jgi:hypothetical protein
MKMNRPILLLLLLLPQLTFASGFKFNIKNTGKNRVAVFYRLNQKSGNVKVKAIFSLEPGQLKEKEISLSKGDTIAFYGQDSEEQTSITVKRDYATLEKKLNTQYSQSRSSCLKKQVRILNHWRG